MAPRNLVVIVPDTLRDPRPLQRGGEVLMPFLTEFARSGITLERLLASSSWTAPSHVSLLTGSDPWTTHFHRPGARRKTPDVESLGGRWQKAGGDSIAFSANLIVAPQLGTAPGYALYNPGFPARIPAYAQVATTVLGYERALYQSLGGGDGTPLGPVGRLQGSIARAAGTGLYRTLNPIRSAGALARSVSALLRRRGTRAGAPLHLFLNTVEAHEPYLRGVNGGPARSPRSMGNLPTFNLARLSPPLARQDGLAAFIEAYRHAIIATDEALRVLVDMLRRLSVLDNAVLAIVSDHGQGLGEHGFYGHAYTLYDELVKVPGYLWEFRDGRPVPMSPPEPEWIDHRHLYDVLESATADGAPLDVAGTLARSLIRRGPATSFFEGPGLRAPDGFTRRVARPPTFRLLRVQRGTTTSVMRSDASGGELHTESADSPDGPSEELDEIARHILGQEIPAAGGPAGPETKMDQEVDARLRSWGYD